MLDNERIKELQRMTKKELIDLIDQLERDKYFLNKEKDMYKGWYEKTEQEREEIYNDMVRYREERAELMDKLYLKKEKIYVEEVKRLARQGYKLKEHNERHAGRKNKFNKEIKFIKPLWYDDNKHNIYYESFSEDQWTKEDRFYKACMNSERDYFQLLDYGLKPQEAREVLINSTKTEIYVTGFKSDWDKFFDLRCDIAAHPEMRRLCIPLKEELFNEIR